VYVLKIRHQSEHSICFSPFLSYPLFAFTPIASGGLGLSEAMIGIHMAIRAVINIFVTMLYPPVERRFGTVRTYQLCMWLWPVTVLGLPLLNAAARNQWIQEHNWVMWVVLWIFWSVWAVAAFVWCMFTLSCALMD
jgi:Na+/melibiose symporter-like transporter